jgi:hypothetical protein
LTLPHGLKRLPYHQPLRIWANQTAQSPGESPHSVGKRALATSTSNRVGAILGRDVFAELWAGAVYAPSRLPVDPPDWDPLVVARPSSPIRRTSRPAGRSSNR